MLGLEGLPAWGRDETVRKPCMCEKRMRKSCTRCTRGSIIEGPTCAQHETQLSGIGSVWPAGHDYLSCRAPHSKCSHQPDPRCPVDLGFLQAPVVHGVVYAGVCVCVCVGKTKSTLPCGSGTQKISTLTRPPDVSG